MPRAKTAGVEDLGVEGVAQLLEKNDMAEFVAFITERQVDGREFLVTTEGTIKLWKPKANAMKLVEFIAQVKSNPAKYVESVKGITVKTDIESQYQKVTAKSVREQNTNVTVSGVEEILKRMVPPKSFLYRNQTSKMMKPIMSYVPMDAGTPKKPKRFFRLSSYEYPHFDIKQRKFSKNETNFNDRGYYSIKTNSRYNLQKTFSKVEARTKYKSLSILETVDKSEDHLYEDLCYNDIDQAAVSSNVENLSNNHVKTYRVKIHELFSSFKLPFFKKTDDVLERDRRVDVETETGKVVTDGHIYENSDSVLSIYSSVQEENEANTVESNKKHKLEVEEYLEPVQVHREYCDVTPCQRDETILGYIRSLFGNRFGIRWDTNETDQSEESQDRPALLDDIRKSPGQTRTNMADRPLPVPVENEPYYMNIDRSEAENLLRGQPDGTFVLRPSGQPNHAYTLTVACSGAVHNVGVRRRTDGRLALGFARRGERSFPSVTSLLRHHGKRRLLLVAGGSVCGATTLNGSPEYYQTPSSLPLDKIIGDRIDDELRASRAQNPMAHMEST